MSEELLELAELITEKMPKSVLGSAVNAMGELTLQIVPADIVDVVEMLKTNRSCRFSSLVDLTAVDYPGRDDRFDVVYHFLSMYTNQRIRLRLAVAEDQVIPSISEVHLAANWFEREAFDMYGIMFSGHPDLRRILTDYGFRGYPLRKDFPTTGYVELRYDDAEKRVVYEPVSLVQEYRQFDFMSPWEGAEYILPGDDKAEAAK